MIKGKKIVVVLPAYNAARTLRAVYAEIPLDIVDDIILTDDHSADDTVNIARDLGIQYVLYHDLNRGYGGNQKTCYQKALEIKADIIVMLHPDYQYSPKLIPAMAALVAEGVHDVVLGSRILGNGALQGGMPLYKFVSNRALTYLQNLVTGANLSEYHTGYRAFSARVLRSIAWSKNSDGFIFDNEILSQIIYAGFSIGEITSPAKYFKEASSINFWKSLWYGTGVLRVAMQHGLQRMGLNHRRYRTVAQLTEYK